MTAPNPPAGTDTGQQGTGTTPTGQQQGNAPANGPQQGSGTTGQPPQGAQGQQGTDSKDQSKDGGDGAGTDLSKLSPADLVKEIEKWKGLSRKHEADSKAGKTAAAELKALKDAQLTQQERDANALKEANERVAAYELKERRVAAAEAIGLPAKWAARITGTTDAELAAEAQSLKADLDELGAGQQQQAPPPGNANLRQGNRGNNGGNAPTPNDFIRQMAGHGR